MIAASPAVPILVALAIIIGIGGPCGVLALTWDRMPWWRSSPKPSRAYRDDRERVRDWKLRKKYPQAFVDPAFADEEDP